MLQLYYFTSHELVFVAFGVVFVAFIGFIDSRDFLNILINTEIAMLGINFYLITASAV